MPFTKPSPLLLRVIRLISRYAFSLFLSFGLLVIANDFRILAYSRFLKLSLLLSPFIFIFICLYLRIFTIPWRALAQHWKEIAGMVLVSLVAGLVLTPYSGAALRFLVTVIIVTFTFAGWTGLALLPAYHGHERYLEALTLFILLLVGLAGMAIFTYMSGFVRMYGDDFCYNLLAQEYGYLRAAIEFYFRWSGRFTSNFLLFAASGNRFSTLLQIAGILLSIFASAWLYARELRFRPVRFSKPVYECKPDRSLDTPNGEIPDKATGKTWRFLWALAAATLLPYLAFSVTPDPYKSIYWIVSSVVVLPILILLPVYLLLLYRTFQREQVKAPVYSLLVFLLAVALTTTHEVATLPVVFLTTLLALPGLFSKNRPAHWRQVTASAMAGSVLGLLITLLAPGNYNRHEDQFYVSSPNLWVLIELNTRHFLAYLGRIAYHDKLLLMFPPLILGYLGKMPGSRGLYAIAASGVTLVMAWLSFIPGAYAAQGEIPLRSELIPTTIFVLGFFCAGLLLPRSEASFVPAAIMCTFILASPVFFKNSLVDDARLVAPIVQYAKAWDKRHRLLSTEDLPTYLLKVPWDAYEQKFFCIGDYYDFVRSGQLVTPRPWPPDFGPP